MYCMNTHHHTRTKCVSVCVCHTLASFRLLCWANGKSTCATGKGSTHLYFVRQASERSLFQKFSFTHLFTISSNDRKLKQRVASMRCLRQCEIYFTGVYFKVVVMVKIMKLGFISKYDFYINIVIKKQMKNLFSRIYLSRCVITYALFKKNIGNIIKIFIFRITTFSINTH